MELFEATEIERASSALAYALQNLSALQSAKPKVASDERNVTLFHTAATVNIIGSNHNGTINTGVNNYSHPSVPSTNSTALFKTLDMKAQRLLDALLLLLRRRLTASISKLSSHALSSDNHHHQNNNTTEASSKQTYSGLSFDVDNTEDIYAFNRKDTNAVAMVHYVRSFVTLGRGKDAETLIADVVVNPYAKYDTN